MDFTRSLSVPFVTLVRKRALLARFRLRFSKPGLGLKLLVLVVGVSLTGVFASSALIVTLQRQQLTDTAQAALTRLSSGVETSLEYAMLKNDRFLLQQIVQNMANREGVADRIRILDSQGIVRVSSMPDEIERRYNQSDAACQFCHSGAATPVSKTTILTAGTNHPDLTNVHVIPNSPECQQCHSPASPILGHLMIEMPLADLDSQLTASIWRIAFSGMVTIALLVGLLLIALRKLVVRPVHELTQGMTEIRAGNLEYPVQLSTGDELGELATAFDMMRKQLQSSLAEKEARTRQLAMLNDLAVDANECLDMQQILELALDAVIGRLGMQAGGIYLRDEETGRFTLRACRGLNERQQNDIERRRQEPEGDLSHRTAQSGQEIFVENMAADPRFQGMWDDLENRSYVNIPLKAKGGAIGTMGLVTHAGQPLNAVGINLLSTIGHEVGAAIDNARLFAETRRREQETVTLYRLMMQIAASLDFDHVVEAIAEGARQILDADIGVVGLVDEERGGIAVRACAGNRTDVWHDLFIPLTGSFSPNSPGPVNPIAIEEWTADLPVPRVAELIEREGVVSSLAGPMWHSGRLYGFVGILTRARRTFARQDVQLFVRFVLQVVVAIENADLYKQVRYMATLEERDRLARELHDNLAQMLGYMNVKTAITKHLLANSDVEGAFASLLELEQVSNQAYTDVREAIFSLRTISASGWELVPTLREYLADYRKHYGIDVQLVMTDETCGRLDPEVQVQVNRIIQEALTNVRKHSGASRAWVQLECDHDSVRFTIEDDGRGFEPAAISGQGSEHFGLQIMRERAASVGGTLDIDSGKQAGTRVVLTVPLF